MFFGPGTAGAEVLFTDGFESCVGQSILVDSTLDVADSNPGDRSCNDGGGNCTLRAAIEEANACVGFDVVEVPADTYVITLGVLSIVDELSLKGSGATTTIVDGNGLSRVFSIGNNLPAVLLSDLTVRNGYNIAGGGFYIGSDTPTTIRRSIVSDNTGTDSGGAFFVDSDAILTLEDSTVTRNQSGASPGGSAFLVKPGAELTIRSSTIADNGPTGSGGGAGVILDWSDASGSPLITIENSTFAQNTGFAVYAYTAAVEFRNSTIAGNDGGLLASVNGVASQINVGNTIIANNGMNCGVNPYGGTIISNGHNIESLNSCNFAATGDQVNTEPMLGALADNGGPTQTHALQAGSPAIDAGNNTNCPATDQRGVSRSDGACDIGAYEF